MISVIFTACTPQKTLIKQKSSRDVEQLSSQNKGNKAEVTDKETEKQFDIKTLTKEDFYIYDSELNQVYEYGQFQSDVEKMSGLKPEKDFMNLYNYDGLSVYYRNDKIAGFAILSNNNLTARFKTHREIGLGSKFEDVKKVYGEPTGNMNDKTYTYFFKKDQNKYTLISSKDILSIMKNHPEDQNLYAMSFYCSQAGGNITMIFLGDYEYQANNK
jgi:hypothetical protein